MTTLLHQATPSSKPAGAGRRAAGVSLPWVIPPNSLPAMTCSPTAASASTSTSRALAAPAGTVGPVPEEFDPAAMVERFRARAAAVRSRGIPPIEGAERQRYIEQAQLDFMDYAMLGDAEAPIEDGVLSSKVDLRPRSDTTEG